MTMFSLPIRMSSRSRKRSTASTRARLARDRRILHDAVDLRLESLCGGGLEFGTLEDIGGGQPAGERDDLRVGQVLDRLADRVALVVADVLREAGPASS